ncbi:putative inorganic phosphate cotransporter isoform X1 [Zeugodacus cucurbitae]|uniref:putative inorganic phosphate cotransporter isoform X1 n=2 Tax=Zeugodacus cucurbitae TaxID=28588 RepID=UPI0023D9067B|nr:putative inorganic phosphate cotransporter isoform X1 [Zeugodacus cucurbitae]
MKSVKLANCKKCPWFGIRHLQALLIFFNIVVVYFSRINVSVSVVAMTNANTTNPDFPEYDWNEKHKSVIISSFYWGYIFTQFPGGYLSRRFGAKIVMFGSTICSAICCVLTPLLISLGGWQAYCAIRIIMGLAQGVIFPAIHQHLGKWSPQKERNFLGTISDCGTDCGIILSMGVSGLIATSSIGWPGISYVSGGACFVWCLIWLIFGYNNAPSARFITPEERAYIESDLLREDNFHQENISVPWLAIFTSVPLLSLLVVRCAQAWGSTTLQAEIPSYMAGVLNMNIKSNALFSALPYVVMFCLKFVYLFSADFVIAKRLLTLTVLRKVCNTCALWIPAGIMIGIGFLDEAQKTLAIVLMILNVGFNAGATIGSTLNTIDLSSNHAGVLMGIVNTIANFVPIVTPLLVGVIVTDEHDRTLWQIVFIIAAAIFFFGNLVYVIFGSALTQPWDAPNFLTRDNIENDLSKPELNGKQLVTSMGDVDKVNSIVNPEVVTAVKVTYNGALNNALELSEEPEELTVETSQTDLSNNNKETV